MTDRLYLEDMAPGMTMRSGELTVTAEDIMGFASQYDPQPFHLDDAAAAGTLFAGLVASGWHTASLTMRLQVTGGLPLAGGIIGSRVDELTWPRPVRPGDTLRVETEVIEARPSSSRPEQGWAKLRSITRNQRDEPVMVLVVNLLVPSREKSAS